MRIFVITRPKMIMIYIYICCNWVIVILWDLSYFLTGMRCTEVIGMDHYRIRWGIASIAQNSFPLLEYVCAVKYFGWQGLIWHVLLWRSLVVFCMYLWFTKFHVRTLICIGTYRLIDNNFILLGDLNLPDLSEYNCGRSQISNFVSLFLNCVKLLRKAYHIFVMET